MTEELTAVIEIGGWSSHCSNCHREATYSETNHFTLLGYGPDNGRPGCGARFVAMESPYGDDLSYLGLDLPQVGWIGGINGRLVEMPTND